MSEYGINYEERGKSTRDFIAKIHNSDGPIDDGAVDRMLGIEIHGRDSEMEHIKQNPKDKDEQLFYQGISYEKIRTFLHKLQLTDQDIFYDLGSGVGRAVLYVASTTLAKSKGIELVAERSEKAQKAKILLGLDRAEFITSNILDADYSDGTVFLLQSSFQEETLMKVIDELRKIAVGKSIRIVSSGLATAKLNNHAWLKATDRDFERDIIIYESIDLPKDVWPGIPG